MKKNIKIAIVYDWFDKWGGVERILLVLKEIFPQAHFFTSYFDKKEAFWAKNFILKTSFIDKLPLFIKKNRILSLPFFPFAFESFDFSNYNLVITITSAFAKAIITKPSTYHLCYLLTPPRYLWFFENLYLTNNFVRGLILPYLNYLRYFDFLTGQRPDKIIAISKSVANRCLKIYRRKAEVIYPPFDIEYWKRIEKKPKKILLPFNKNYFLVVSRLEPYKRIDLLIKVFNQLEEKLIIVGRGSQLQKFKKMAKKNIFFIPKLLTDFELGYLYLNANAVILPQEEDFGYVSLESQFFGCPVIAFKKGGATETILENVTGIFFHKEKEILHLIKKFHTISYNLKNQTKKWGKKQTEKFSKKNFINHFLKILENNL